MGNELSYHRRAMLCLLGVLLGACGQTGPLVLPDAQSQSQPAGADPEEDDEDDLSQ